MFGKLDWSAIPLSEPIPLIAGAAVLLVVAAVIACQRLVGLSVARVDHQRRP
jgi:cytochrome o ubiquinol oxidase subunit 1